MFKKAVITIISLLILIFFVNLGIAEKIEEVSEILIDHFRFDSRINIKYKDDYKEGNFPPDWDYRDKKAKDIYSLKKNGESDFYLHAKSEKEGVQILKKIKVDINKYPILTWKWRLRKAPGENGITKENISDDGASVYAIFPSGLFSNKILKYSWNNYSEKGFTRDKGRLKIKVIRDKGDPKDVWITEEVNLLEDFKERFDRKKAKRLKAIAIMTDSDQTKSFAEADYDDFYLKKLPPPPKKLLEEKTKDQNQDPNQNQNQ